MILIDYHSNTCFDLYNFGTNLKSKTMMKTTLAIITLLISLLTYSQVQYDLDFNNVKASINTNGILFNDGNNSIAGYKVPKSGGVSAIYASAFWFGGTDVNGGLRLAAQRFPADLDLFTGPLSTFGGGFASNGVPYGDANIIASEITAYDRIWTITQAEIDDFVQNWNAGTITNLPQVILDWPAHGDPSLGQDFYLAPFYDNPNGPNGANGIYDPIIDGDVPVIRGAKASYMILNDKGSIHASEGEPIGLELHFMIYQYGYDNYLNNTTFVNLKVINRGTLTLNDFKVANYTDGDVGYGFDDYFGSDSARSLIYTYNGDANDVGGAASYGLNPPAVGVKLLNHSAVVAGYYNNSPGVMEGPDTAPEYYGFMQGNWGNSGNPFVYGNDGLNGTVPTNFLFSDINGWSEASVNNVPGDRRMFMCAEETVLSPGDMICYDFAFLYARSFDGTLDGSVLKLLDIADGVQTFYNDQQHYNCLRAPVTTLTVNQNNHQNQFTVYPMPSNDYFKIKMEGQFDVTLYTIDGKLILNKINLNANDKVMHNLPVGVYIVQVNQNGQTAYQKMMIEK